MQQLTDLHTSGTGRSYGNLPLWALFKMLPFVQYGVGRGVGGESAAYLFSAVRLQVMMPRGQGVPSS